MMDETEDPDFSKSIKLRQLAVMANRLTRIMDDTWNTYTGLFDLLDTKDIATNERATDAILEFEYELIDMLAAIRVHLGLLRLVNEPLPTIEVEDFESAVLRDIAKIDDVDLEKFRSTAVNSEEEDE